MYNTILINTTNGVGRITFNRPEALNALDDVMREEIRLAIEDMAANEDVRVVVLTGSGRAFCAGGDVKAQAKGFDAQTGRERIRNLDRLLFTMANIEKPIICAVNGLAVGGGCNLALSGDIIIAAEEAKFSQIFVNIGLIPDFGGMYLLPRLVGLPKAKELVFTGRMIDANEANEMGMINRVVPADQLLTVVTELAENIAGKSKTAIAMAKSLLNRSLESDLSTMIELEAFAQGICFQSEEHRQLLKSFLASRKSGSKKD